MATLRFQKVVADCELLKLALEPLLDQFPHLSAEHDELVQFLVRIKGLNQEASALKGQFTQAIRLRREAELDGMDLRLRVATQLRGTNEELTRFGLAPRRRPRRRPQDESPPPGEDPPGEEPESPPVE
jgi:hypothetical protein